MTDFRIILGSSILSMRQTTHAGPGVKPWLSSLFQKYIATEHRCALPDDRQTWVAVPEAYARRHRNSIYVCPECGARFAVEERLSM